MDDFVTYLRAQWDRALAVALLVVGAVLLIVGWVTVSGASSVADQLSFLASSGLGGLFCLGLGSSLLVSSNLQDEWRKLDELAEAVRGTIGTAEPAQHTTASPIPAAPRATRVADPEDHEVVHFLAN